ncbi:MAG: peptidylprolyl isomerase [Verrucomicrobia bacterium TMED56]|nr:MAG: peptidylprolyl isomerase [Verrucomicrobia bacterium TMED56]
MKKYFACLLLLLPLAMTEAKPKAEDTLTIELKDGPVVIELFRDVAPKHVERITKLAEEGKYDGVAFHRVIDGFMAQTGDVEFGNKKEFSAGRAGTGGSDLPDLKEEFNNKKHVRGTCSMARAASPDSANSQFFICFDDSSFLDGQYTVWGQVIEGMDYVDKIKRGSSSSNGSVNEPDHMIKVTVGKKSQPEESSKE